MEDKTRIYLNIWVLGLSLSILILASLLVKNIQDGKNPFQVSNNYQVNDQLPTDPSTSTEHTQESGYGLGMSSSGKMGLYPSGQMGIGVDEDGEPTMGFGF